MWGGSPYCESFLTHSEMKEVVHPKMNIDFTQSLTHPCVIPNLYSFRGQYCKRDPNNSQTIFKVFRSHMIALHDEQTLNFLFESLSQFRTSEFQDVCELDQLIY